jgi:hypothetical protein
MANNIPMYQIDENDNIVVTEYKEIEYSSNTVSNTNDGQTGFYLVRNENNEIIEAGYQHYSTAKDPWYIIALPDSLNVAEDGNVQLRTWDPAESKWANAQYVLTGNYEEIEAAYNDVDIEPPVAPEGYRLWADLTEPDPGTMYRFVIKE